MNIEPVKPPKDSKDGVISNVIWLLVIFLTTITVGFLIISYTDGAITNALMFFLGYNSSERFRKALT